MLQMTFSHDKANEVEKTLVSMYTRLLSELLKDIFYFKSTHSKEQYYHQPTLEYNNLFAISQGVRTNIDALTSRVETSIQELLTTELDMFTEHLTFLYKEVLDDEDSLKLALEDKWIGTNYQDVLNESTRQYLFKIKREVHASLVRGDSNTKIKNSLTKLMNSFMKKIITILNTETTYITNQALLDNGIYLGYTHIKINEVLDSRTCSYCKSMDGKVVAIKDAKYGVTIPPFHTSCRGTLDYI